MEVRTVIKKDLIKGRKKMQQSWKIFNTYHTGSLYVFAYDKRMFEYR